MRSTRGSPSCSGAASCATPAGLRKPGSRAPTSRSGGSPRGAGTAETTRTIPRCRSTWSNVSARSGRGSLRSTGRTRATAGATSSTPTNSPAAPRRRQRRGRRCRCCRRRLTRLACDLFDEIAAAAGLTTVKETSASRGLSPRCFELDADTVIETRDHGAMTVAELERLRCGRRDATTTLRCSGSFHDRTRVRTDSHLINWGRYGLGIYDTMTETTWHRRERAPSARFEFLGQLQERNPFQ